MVLDGVVVFIFLMKYNKIAIRIIILVLSTVLLIGESLWKTDNITREFLFRNQDILYSKDTPYGNLTITKQGEQKNFYENNGLLFSTNNPSMNEEAVHYAMVQHPNPKNVLLISGGISGTIDEILKYNIEKVDYVEINPWLINIGKNYPLSKIGELSRKVNVINQDARLFVKSTLVKLF